MSEVISAFAAYSSATKTKKNKNASKKNTSIGKKLAAANKKSNDGSTKKKVIDRNNKKQQANGVGKKNGDTKETVKSDGVQRKTNNNNNRNRGEGIREIEVDKLVGEFLENTPSNPKKQNKAQQKKRKELEAYLLKQVNKFHREGDVSEDDDGDGDNGGPNDKSSDEYNSFSASNGESSKEDDVADEEQVNHANNVEAFSLDALEKSILSRSKATKRQSIDVASTSRNKSLTDALNETKKSKKSKETSNNNRRKSLPAPKQKDALKSISSSTPKLGNVSLACKQVVAQRGVKMEPRSPPSSATHSNSIDEGGKMFTWLMQPVRIEEFFSKFWEKNACLVKRQQENYFSHLISFEAIDQMLLKNHVEFTKNIDVTSYKNGVRETLNPEGRALPPVVWDHYGQGCSIRLLNPQTFLSPLSILSATLQEYFHCLVGANAYLTPPNSQGFAPHYDDIEAFVLQIEGRKRWKLYRPRNSSEQLPRVSSANFEQSDIGEPILEEVLKPGDILYFPRGTIHQACTEPGYHSLHITLSVYQKQSYADLFERMVPQMLQNAIASNVDLRRGLPLHTWHNAGIAFSDVDTRERADLRNTVSKMLTKLLRETPIGDMLDAAVDQLAKKFQHEALPPEIQSAERLRTIFGSRSTTNENGECVCDYDITLLTSVRLLRANIMRLVRENDKVNIYYYVDNSKEYCEYEPNFIEIDPDEAGSVEVLIKSYPAYVGVSQLPIEDDERKIQVVTALWERGLLMMEKPFK